MVHNGQDNKPVDLANTVGSLSLRREGSRTSDGDVRPDNGMNMRLLSLSHRAPSTDSVLAGCQQNSTPLSTSKPGSPMELDGEVMIGSEIMVKAAPDSVLKLSRNAAHKIKPATPRLFLDVADATSEALTTFDVIHECTYANKYLGITDHALECDCGEEWDPLTSTNDACNEDSDCINRATKMECVSDCVCGEACQNRRFQQQEYADVTVIKTEKKGFGLRTNTKLRPHQLIYEYIGEVIGESKFRTRMSQYDEEGIKHFYFMSLSKGEFIDATRRGNLGRFCNHSCNPNCYVDKWVVGDRLRMGIFAERSILCGEELVFNYNVDRYGANPQPCYCGEANCTGFIGGKTQTERATKLSTNTIEALGIEDADDWDLAVARKSKKRGKAGEADEEYVDRVQPKSLDEGAVTKVMATLMQCKEKWIVIKLLCRIQQSEDERVRTRVVKMHGYRILKSVLSTFHEDVNVVLQVLDILDTLPRITRNKIQDSKIESTVETLKDFEDERVRGKARTLLDIWSALEVAYRIPRAKRNAAATITTRPEYDDRRRMARERSRSRSRERSISPAIPRGPAADKANVPSGPRSQSGARSNFNMSKGGQPFRRHITVQLPAGWFQAYNKGRVYYYNQAGQTSWERPTKPALPENKEPTPQIKSHEQKLQDIIESITSKPTVTNPRALGNTSPKPKPPTSPPRLTEPKWKQWTQDKQMKLYENTIFPHIKYMVNKYKDRLPNEDLKRFAKDISKKLVASDYKNNRVTDPSSVEDRQVRKIKVFCKDFLDRAVQKRQARVQGGANHKAMSQLNETASPAIISPSSTPTPLLIDEQETEGSSMLTPCDLADDDNSCRMDTKRKRTEDLLMKSPGSKRLRPEDVPSPPDPPTPPPPPPSPPSPPLPSLSPTPPVSTLDPVDGAMSGHRMVTTHTDAEADDTSDTKVSDEQFEKATEEASDQRSLSSAIGDFCDVKVS